MAAAASVPDAIAPTQKKRPRLNPARRKTAKAKVQSEATPAVSVAKTRGESALEVKKSSPTASIKPKPSTRQNSIPTACSSSHSVVKPTRAAPKSSQKCQNSAKQDLPPPPGAGGGSNASTVALAAPSFVTGGLLGCAAGAAVLLGSGLLKNAVGVDSAVLAARSAKAVLNNLIDDSITSMKAGTYSSADSLDMLRRTTLAYATLVPGGAPFVERMFREVEMIRRQRGHEVDKVVADASAELSVAGKKGAGPAELQSIIVSNLVKISQFAGTATQDIVARNPRLSPFRDGAAKALRPPPQPKTPTLKLNMTMKQKQTAAA
ncbi:hypothetical protein CLAFUW4_09242 [Fulvia fulva]|uniref:Uncharacterized protein n=1 Tax=Passalora fulva TaxID=5499 RepID=A0A9Q8UT37_PASFU|nr:uncharacterized protein CLAFUR5_09343 [Fulvia fulva]KAK4613331.1 hypothetical protein CLAFUR4_09248 [Fulvia fulva]KAK4614416.1 hypothetical protein CLAFUR0_09240 [Fulvia fulva]UJO21489.1 hypothetical protein CLAFUR5_09343 [Fulvia fulva]WPV20759.1 hypothetical protein CLAFUW4_09242 [Fulvia fulva]WPV34789.1 hypothetical protein CLAFUW7_09243 [Fulvia fulva]